MMMLNSNNCILAVLAGFIIISSCSVCPPAAAFTAVSPHSRIANRQVLSQRKSSLVVLGPIARNGLGYDDVELGQGRRILPGDTVYCYYTGSFPEVAPKGPFGGFLGAGSAETEVKNTVFDQVTEGEPFSFEVGKGQVIKGMDYGILGFDDEVPPMNVGGKRKLLIPSPLAYGESQVGPIPANQDLEFELQVLDAGKESDVSLQFRLGGYAVALGVPIILLLIGFTVIPNL